MIATPETRDRPRAPVPHALVVGGTGMLRGLTLSLVREGYTVSVVARNRERLRVLAAEAAKAAKARDIPAWLCRYPRIRYRQVILGFVIEGGRSRWLTHQEISDGVLKAVHQDAAWSVVGTVEPWSMRP